jgi:hypothetical protein
VLIITLARGLGVAKGIALAVQWDKARYSPPVGATQVPRCIHVYNDYLDNRLALPARYDRV